jgi:hypothetical protein
MVGGRYHVQPAFMIRSLCSFALTTVLLTASPAEPDWTPGKFESITLERTVCFGVCPSYRVQVFSDGRVEYEGKQFVKVRGKRTKRLASAQMNALRAELASSRYFELRDQYRYPQDGCTVTWTDSPRAITSVRVGARSKSIDHDYGCRTKHGLGGETYPVELTRFESRLDEILQTSEWVGRPGESLK